MSGRYFDDLAVGQPFGSGRLRVDKEQIKDSIPNHSISTKTRRCTQSSDGLAASGWHACVQLDHYPSFFLQSRERFHAQGPSRSVFGCVEKAVGELQSRGQKRILRERNAGPPQILEQ